MLVYYLLAFVFCLGLIAAFKHWKSVSIELDPEFLDKILSKFKQSEYLYKNQDLELKIHEVNARRRKLYPFEFTRAIIHTPCKTELFLSFPKIKGHMFFVILKTGEVIAIAKDKKEFGLCWNFLGYPSPSKLLLSRSFRERMKELIDNGKIAPHEVDTVLELSFVFSTDDHSNTMHYHKVEIDILEDAPDYICKIFHSRLEQIPCTEQN